MSQTYYRPQPFEDRTPCAECGDRYRKVGLVRGVEYCEKCLPILLDRAREAGESRKANQKALWAWEEALASYCKSLYKKGLTQEDQRPLVKDWKRQNPKP